ncbi:MAG TPA: hypothetical protein EYQ64_10040 [Gemmatimonadetes bacterium]|nr:hypothetical protein [Gemmatimonadota bacterium]
MGTVSGRCGVPFVCGDACADHSVLGHDVEDALDYFEDFWRVIDDPDEFQDEIIDDCRDPETGD